MSKKTKTAKQAATSRKAGAEGLAVSAGSRSDARNRFFLAAFAKANRGKGKKDLLAALKMSEQDAKAQHLPIKYALQIRSLLITNKLI